MEPRPNCPGWCRTAGCVSRPVSSPGLATRLTARLRAGDPLAARVKLKGVDVLASILGALRFAT